MSTHSTSLKIGGAALIASSLAFVAVFGYLARAFGYPDVLLQNADAVLPALLAGGRPLRTVWFIYAVLPLGIVVAGAASARLLDSAGSSVRAAGTGAAVAAGIAMMVGLVRWPTIEWTLARHWESASSPTRAALAAFFDASNLFLGTVVGELVGELCLAGWFFALAIAFRADGRRVLGYLGIAAALLMTLAGLRNLTTVVAPFAQANNLVLPLWLLTIGTVLFREGSRRSRDGAAAARSPVAADLRVSTSASAERPASTP